MQDIARRWLGSCRAQPLQWYRCIRGGLARSSDRIRRSLLDDPRREGAAHAVHLCELDCLGLASRALHAEMAAGFVGDGVEILNGLALL